MGSLDEGIEWHPTTMWYSASSLGLLASVVLAVLFGVLAARAVTMHSRHLSLPAPRLASLGDGRPVQRIMLKGMTELPAEDAAPAIWIPAALMETSQPDYAFPAAAVVPDEAGNRRARSARALARQKNVQQKAPSVRRRAASKVHAARPSNKKQVASGKRRRKVALRTPAQGIEVARGRKTAKHRRARANNARPANQRRGDKPRVTQHRRLRPS